MSKAERRVDEAFAHDYALERVPDEKRRGLYAMVAVWVGWAVSVSGFLVGGVIGAGRTAASGLLAVLLGNLVLVLIASLVGVVGYRTGLTTYSTARIIFGKRGSVFVSLVLGILAMGFIGVLLDAFGKALHALIPAVPVWAAVLVFSFLVTLTAIYGFKGLAFLSVIAAPMLWALIALAVGLSIKEAGSLSALFAVVPKKPISFTAAMGSAVATWVTGAAICSDIARYARSARDVVLGAFAGYVLGAGLLEGASVLAAVGVGSPDIVKILSSLGLLLPAVLTLLIALWTTTDNNIYSTALAFKNLGQIINLNLSKPTWTIIAILIAIITSTFGFAGKFVVWLRLIGIVTPPFAGCLIAHFWILNRPHTASVRVAEGVLWKAFVAWLGASVIAYFVRFGIPAVISLVVGLVLYTLINLVWPDRSTS